MIKEKSLVLKKETRFDKIREILFKVVLYKDYEIDMIKRLNNLLYKNKRPNGKIIIPKEIKF